MSKREELYRSLIEELERQRLMTSPMAGIEARLESRGKPYSVTFGTARYMDGVMIVFGPTFIQFKIQGSPMNNGRHQTSYIVRSEKKARKFIQALGQADKDGALAQVDE